MSVNANSEVARDEKPGECPECGGSVYREPMCVHGGPNETTSGWACLDCTWYEVDDDDDDEPEAWIKQGAIDLGPHGRGNVEDDEFDADDEVYVLEGGCSCGDDLHVAVFEVDPEDIWQPAAPQFRPIGEVCPSCGTQG